MSQQVKAVPDGFHTITPHLTVRDAKKAIEFYKNAFGAVEEGVMHTPDGKVMHATLRIGDSPIMLNDESPEWGNLSPLSTSGSGFTVHLYLENVDGVFEKAVAAGATAKMPVMDMFWGDRYGQVKDPFGYTWSLATHVADLSPEQMEKGAKEAMAAMAAQHAQKKTA
jgi:PhnB protein